MGIWCSRYPKSNHVHNVLSSWSNYFDFRSNVDLRKYLPHKEYKWSQCKLSSKRWSWLTVHVEFKEHEMIKIIFLPTLLIKRMAKYWRCCPFNLLEDEHWLINSECVALMWLDQ